MKEWDPEAGAWIQNKPQNRFYSGYHIDQRIAPWIKTLPTTHPNSIEAKRIRYRSERRFLNEVLGLFYRGLAKPLINEDMLACRDFGFSLLQRLDPSLESFMGIDWGGGEFAFTVAWIMALETSTQQVGGNGK